MNANDKKILRAVALWELVQGAEAEVGMPGLSRIYLAKLSPDDRALVAAYRKEKADASRELADMLESGGKQA